MKRLLIVCTVLCLFFGVALAEPRPYAIPDTGYSLALPDGWTITETGDDPASALLVANGNDIELYLWLNRQDGWQMNDWEAALQKAAAKNGVLPDSFADEIIAERAFVSYRYERDEQRSMMFATELTAGVFLTFEFRTEGDFSRFDEQRKLMDATLDSLACESPWAASIREASAQWEQENSPSGQALTATERDVPGKPNGGLPGTLYYNPDGGMYYHYDANCQSVSPKYCPLKPFDGELLTARPEYSVLKSCPICAR